MLCQQLAILAEFPGGSQDLRSRVPGLLGGGRYERNAACNLACSLVGLRNTFRDVARGGRLFSDRRSDTIGQLVDLPDRLGNRVDRRGRRLRGFLNGVDLAFYFFGCFRRLAGKSFYFRCNDGETFAAFSRAGGLDCGV